MRILKHYRFGKFAGFIRSLNKKRFFKLRQIQKNLSRKPGNSQCVVCGGVKLELVAESDRFGLRFDKRLCLACGLMQTNPMPPKEFFNKFYDLDYRKLYRGDRELDLPKILELQRARAREFRKFIEKYNHNEISKVFEIGCSYGGNLDVFKELGYSVSGCDLDTSAIKLARQRHPTTFVAEVPSEQSQQPTIYVLSHVLEHIPDPIIFLKKIYSIMTKSDLLFIEVPGLVPLLEGSYRGNLLNFIHIGHVLEFNEQTLKYTVEQAGYETIASNEKCRGIFKKGQVISAGRHNNYALTKNQLVCIESKYQDKLRKKFRFGP